MKLINAGISSVYMATCGYLCPSCEGTTFMDDGSPCTWCQQALAPVTPKKILTDEEWIQSVHFGSCCSDPVIEKMTGKKNKEL